MIVREIETEVVPVTEKKDGKEVPVMKEGKPVTKVVPKLDAEGREIEISAIEIPREVEAEGGAAIDKYVAEQRAKIAAEKAAEPKTDTPAKRGGKEKA